MSCDRQNQAVCDPEITPITITGTGSVISPISGLSATNLLISPLSFLADIDGMIYVLILPSSSGAQKMYTLRLTVRDDEGGSPVERPPFKHVPLSANSDDEAIKLGQAQIEEHMPAGYTLVRARVCRGEDVIWSSDNAT